MPTPCMKVSREILSPLDDTHRSRSSTSSLDALLQALQKFVFSRRSLWVRNRQRLKKIYGRLSKVSNIALEDSHEV
jgi:hypothetical protein